MFNDEEMKAFYAGKENGYKGKEYSNPHLDFVSGLGGAAGVAESRLHDNYKRGFDWGKAQKDEEQSS